jgi:hypothetical protein
MIESSRVHEVTVFSLILLAKLLNLRALLLDLLLLLLNLSLGLLIRSFLVLHRVANRVTAYSAQSGADRGARTRMTDRSANNRASAGPKACTTQSALFTCGKWLPGTSCGENRRSQSGHDRKSDTHERPPH